MQNEEPFFFFFFTFAKRNMHQSFLAILDLYFPKSSQGPLCPPMPAQQQAPVCIPVGGEFCRARVQPHLLPDPGTVSLCQSRCLPQVGDGRAWHSNLMDPEVSHLILRVCAGYVVRNLPSDTEGLITSPGEVKLLLIVDSVSSFPHREIWTLSGVGPWFGRQRMLF